MVRGTSGSDRFTGTNGDDQFFGLDGNDTLIGSIGNDFFDGGSGFNTADYSSLSAQLTLKPTGALEKSGLGTDQLFKVQRIIGSNNFNIIDASTAGGAVSIDVNLAQESLVVSNIPGLGALNLSVARFNWVIGTNNADRIVGGQASDLLRGLAGNDTIVGGGADDILIGQGGNDFVDGQSGRDRLLGTDNDTRGRNEVDVVIGGSGNDGFVLGSRVGSFYNNNGNDDLIRIPDFSKGDFFELGINQTYQAERTSRGFNLLAVQNGTRDLVAEVTTTSFIKLPQNNFTITANQGVGIFRPSASF
jgi:Ca2+-binding RTX toxin-like protein